MSTINSTTHIADGAVTMGYIAKSTGFSTTAAKRGPKAALSAAGTAKHVGVFKRTMATTLPVEVQTSGIVDYAVAGGVLTLGTEYWLTSDASGKFVAAVNGDNVVAKLISVNNGTGASTDGGGITVELCSFFLAANN